MQTLWGWRLPNTSFVSLYLHHRALPVLHSLFDHPVSPDSDQAYGAAWARGFVPGIKFWALLLGRCCSWMCLTTSFTEFAKRYQHFRIQRQPTNPEVVSIDLQLRMVFMAGRWRRTSLADMALRIPAPWSDRSAAGLDPVQSQDIVWSGGTNFAEPLRTIAAHHAEVQQSQWRTCSDMISGLLVEFCLVFKFGQYLCLSVSSNLQAEVWL